MNQKIKKTDLLNILEPHLTNFLDQEDYDIIDNDLEKIKQYIKSKI